MKRKGNLKNIWCSYETLLNAFNQVKAHKSYHHNFLRFESNMVSNLNRILTELESDSYEVKEPRVFYVHDPKTRLIEAPHLEDRIVQHAVLSVVRKLIEDRFIDTTFACIKNRGTHKASDLLVKYLLNFNDTGYFLKMDIKKFFYSIDHTVLKTKLEKIIKCRATLNLLYKFFENLSGKGLPLGSVTSQVFANLMLNDLDHFIKRERKHKYYLRYMDDLIILDDDKEKLSKTLNLCKIVIEDLKLSLNNKTQVGHISRGIDFVGYKTHYNRRVIRKRSLFKIKRSLANNAALSRVSSYLAHAKRTCSIKYIVNKVKEAAPQHMAFVELWVNKNLRKNNYENINYNIALTDDGLISSAPVPN